MSASNAKLKRRVEQEQQMITQGRSQAIPSRRSQPVAHPNDARNFEQATLAAAATTTINGVRSTSIPLPNFGDPTTPVRQQRFGFKHDDHTDWRIRLPFTEFIIHLWWLKWSEEEGKSLQTRDGNVMMLYMTGWSQLPKDYGWEESKFFSPGRVFAIPWPTKPEKCLSDDVSEVQKLTEQYFVVIRSDETGHFTLPISSYNGQGVQNLGAVAWEHGIIYTTEHAPKPLPGELARPGEMGLQPISIKVEASDRGAGLPQTSRVNYGESCYIGNVPVRKIGRVRDGHLTKHLTNLILTHQRVWSIKSNLGSQADSRGSKRDSAVAVVTSVNPRDQRQTAESRAFDMSNMKIAVPQLEPSPISGKQVTNEHAYSRQTTTSVQPVDGTAANNLQAQRFAQIMGTDILTLQRLRSQDPQRYSAIVQEYRRREKALEQSQNEEDEDDDEDEDDEVEEREEEREEERQEEREEDSEEDSEEDGDDDYDEADGDDEARSPPRPHAGSKTQSRASKGKGSRPPPQSKSSQRSTPHSATSSHDQRNLPSRSQQRDGPIAGSSSRTQSDLIRTAGHSQALTQSQSRMIASSNRAPSTGSAQSQQDQVIKAMIADLIAQGYKQEDATALVRARSSAR